MTVSPLCGDHAHQPEVTTIRAVDDGTCVLVAERDLTADRLDEVRRGLSTVLATEEVRTCVLVLAGVSLVSAAAIPEVLGVDAAMRQRGGRLVVLDASPHVERVLGVSGIARIAPADLDDRELAAGLRGGSVAAFTEIQRRHTSAVVRAASRVVGAFDAEDVANDVLVSLWTSPGAFDPVRSRLSTYLAIRARGFAIDRLRSDTRRSAREEGVQEEAVPQRSVEDLATDSDLAEIVRAAVLRLPAIEREAITAAFFGELSYRRVAEALDLPEGTVKGRIRTGLTRLRQELARQAT